VLFAGAVGVLMVVGHSSRKIRGVTPEPWRQFLPSGSVRVDVGPNQGSVWRVHIRNSFVATHRSSYVYLPRYERGVRYPVVYLLHGFPGSPGTFIRTSRLAAVADGLIRSNKLRAVIVVMPTAGKTIRYDGEWGGAWERFVVDDVLPWTDTHLPTIASPAGRAIGGLSAGGYGALNTALRHPELFGTIEAWSGYFHPLHDGPFVHANGAQLAANDPTRLVQRLAPSFRELRVRVFLTAGRQDPFGVTQARQFAALLARLRIAHTFVLRPGGHHASFWSRTLAPALEYAFPPSEPAARS
jgi:enterochelin esterase-like enzyme